MVVPEQEPARSRVVLALQGAQRKSMGSQRPKMAFLAVFVAVADIGPEGEGRQSGGRFSHPAKGINSRCREVGDSPLFLTLL